MECTPSRISGWGGIHLPCGCRDPVTVAQPKGQALEGCAGAAATSGKDRVSVALMVVVAMPAMAVVAGTGADLLLHIKTCEDDTRTWMGRVLNTLKM